MSATMTSMQRVLTALSHKEADRVPFFLCLTMHGARELGVSIKDYYSKTENVVEGQFRMREKYGHDCYYAFQYAAMDLEPWGGSVVFVEDGPPNAGRPVITSPKAIMDLQSPDPHAGPSTERMLESIRRMKIKAGNDVPIIGCVISPFSLPVMQMGFDKYIELLYEEPEAFERLMALNEEFSVRWANAQIEAGATVVVYFDPVSSTSIIPPALSRKTGLAIARRTIARIKGTVAFHSAAGRCLPLLDDLENIGSGIIGVSALEELSELKQACRNKLTLVGNLNGIEMRRWSRTETQTAVKQVLSEGAQGGGFILCDNHGEIPYQVPDEVLLTIADTVKTWGRYPLQQEIHVTR